MCTALALIQWAKRSLLSIVGSFFHEEITMQTVNILGNEYKIEVHKWGEDELLKNYSRSGYTCDSEPTIVIADFDDTEIFEFHSEKDKDLYTKKILRHEIIHAFLTNSGLDSCSFKSNSAWAENEEMVDWIAIQFPKMQKAFEEVGAL